MARFENVEVQAATNRQRLLTQWVACERLVINYVNDGAARELLHMEHVAREYLNSYPTKDTVAMGLVGLKKLTCKLLGDGYIQDE